MAVIRQANKLRAGSASMSGGNVGGWQLAAGHFVSKKLDPELIFPRPDSETPAWAKHRRHYPGIRYEIPIGVAFGSWPFYFEKIVAPAGTTVGAFLAQSGDKLVVTDDFGVVSWDNPTVGTHSFHVRVHFQDGTAPLNVQWTLEVTTAGTIFMDAVNGSDTNPGTLAAPLKTMDGWYKLAYTDRTYHGYQVCYKNGTYDIASADPASPNLRLEFQNKPLVHYAYPGHSPVWNFTNTINFGVATSPQEYVGGEWHMSDWYLGGITCSGGLQGYSQRRWFVGGYARGPFAYDGTGGGQRCTWYKSPQIDWVYTGDPANNAGILFGSDVLDESKRRNHWLIDRVNISGVYSDSAYATTNWNGWYIGNLSLALFQNCTVTGTNFGKNAFCAKSSQWKTCYRNIDFSQAPNQRIQIDTTGEYATLIGGYNEISYCKANYQFNGAGGTLLLFNFHNYAFDGAQPYEKENWAYRNSWSKAPATLGEIIRSMADWPTYVEKDVWCSSGDGIYLNGPANTQAAGDWLLYSIASNPFDSSLNLTGAARTQYLGTHGAEVA